MASCTQEPPAAHLAVLQRVFGLPSFREQQYAAVAATLCKRDSLVILPTGAGKSLTFQLPPHLAENAFTVVVGPLIALMRDQVDKCCDKGIEAAVYNSDCDEERKQWVLRDITSEEPCIKLLYTTPESLRQTRFKNALKEACQLGTLLAFAIDEAHCASQWGHDFRPAYLELGSLKDDFPQVPIAAVTASCTTAVEQTIKSLLKLKEPAIIRASFNRPNIQYVVRHKELLLKDASQEGDAVLQDLQAFLRSRAGQCGIIYARTRAFCEHIAAALNSSDDDMEVGCYHAGRDAATRARVLGDWSSGAINVVVATIAFGMGIDRADVRWVVHFNVPGSPEAYYQESGRAGRDGLPCTSVVYVSREDLDFVRCMERPMRAGAAAHMSHMCCSGCCRRKHLLAFFGEKHVACHEDATNVPCDHCANPAAVGRCLAALSKQQDAVSAAIRARMQGFGGQAQIDEQQKEESQGDGLDISLAERMRARFQTAKQMGKVQDRGSSMGAPGIAPARGGQQQQQLQEQQAPVPLQPRWADLPPPTFPAAHIAQAGPSNPQGASIQAGKNEMLEPRHGSMTPPIPASSVAAALSVPQIRKRAAPGDAGFQQPRHTTVESTNNAPDHKAAGRDNKDIAANRQEWCSPDGAEAPATTNKRLCKPLQDSTNNIAGSGTTMGETGLRRVSPSPGMSFESLDQLFQRFQPTGGLHTAEHVHSGPGRTIPAAILKSLDSVGKQDTGSKGKKGKSGARRQSFKPPQRVGPASGPTQ